ncbi:MAG: lysophospholipid acyltransferase family protein [Parvibaculum sp.]|uniref:lysophospholipid acyltransferase family protein n=1 Tax=Parvibaculum sp. TaxID=2024848 RepID=UPI002AB7FB30|nr:lysophospholipid acyltransferase family protein [Parvibaculum sp.]MDZ4382448.1 lysophospholipid acyltransferase family protein [Parvibaculum sp.]
MLFLRSAAFNLTFYALSVVIVIAAVPCFLLPRGCTFAAMKFWSHMTLWLLRVLAGTTYEVRGRLPQGGVLVASKHQSMWDTIVMTAILKNPAMVLKRELLWIPFYGWYAMKSRMIAIDRGSGSKAIRRLVSQGKAALADGRPIVIFPEGTRSAPGSKLDYKPGVAALYRQLGAGCVPAAVNSGLFWGRRGFTRRPGTIVIEFLEPIPAGLDRKTFMEQLETRIETAAARLVEEARGT